MKKKLIFIISLFFFVFLIFTVNTLAQNQISPTPKPCEGTGCPSTPSFLDYKCAKSYEDWLNNPEKNYWVEDSEVTFLGKNAERARQLLYWTLNRGPIYYHPSIIQSWSSARDFAFGLIVLLATLAGALFILNSRFNFSERIDVKKFFLKIGGSLLFIVFSATITLSAIQLSDLLMKFFMENLKVGNLFNIFFTENNGFILKQSEEAYKNFVGCKNLSMLAQESFRVSMFLLKITNLTYFLLALLLLIRRFILWFFVIISPFFAVLYFFKTIRNVGKTWLGVFLQWVFYGPLLALFLGTTAKMWQLGIPFNFNFSRINSAEGYIYPTAVSILYGGPSQHLSFTNSSNYIDTFMEYALAILMLWIAIFLPWWLLRSFRDYCCDGIYAIKNLLLAFYEKSSGKKPSIPPSLPDLKTALKSVIRTKEPIKEKITFKTDQIKSISTKDLLKNIHLEVKTLQDIAKIETTKEHREKIQKIITSLKQPDRIADPHEREKIMQFKTELYQRAKKQDKIAQKLLNLTSSSVIQTQKVKKEIIEKIAPVGSLQASLSSSLNLTPKKTSALINNLIQNFIQKPMLINSLSQVVALPKEKVAQILTEFVNNLNSPLIKTLSRIQKNTQIKREKVKQTLKEFSNINKTSKIISQTAIKENLEKEKIKETLKEIYKNPLQTDLQKIKILSAINNSILNDKTTINLLTQLTGMKEETLQQVLQHPESPENTKNLATIYKILLESDEAIENVSQQTGIDRQTIEKAVLEVIPEITEADKNIEKTIPIPATTSIDEYENTKRLWKNHYLKGEVPISENISSRKEWVEQDIIYLTNVLNKLLSGDEKLKEEALEELSYLLPIFIINDLSPEKLLVYLKAKLEAAKEVKEELEKEEELKAKLKREIEKEELVEVPLEEKKEKPKQQELKQELSQQLPEGENEV